MEYQLLDKLDRIRSLARAYELRRELNDEAGAHDTLEQLEYHAQALAEEELVDRDIRIRVADGGHHTGICRGVARLPGDLRPGGVAVQHQRKGKWHVTIVPFESIREIQLPKPTRGNSPEARP